jgi:hypothetical protein
VRDSLRDSSARLARQVGVEQVGGLGLRPRHEVPAIALLAEQARQGIAASAVAYERALRPTHADPVQARIDELAARRRARREAS